MARYISEPQKLKGSIIVTCPQGHKAPGEDVHIRIDDETSGIVIADIYMSFENYGHMLAQSMNMPCMIELRQSDKIGKKMEYKTEVVDLEYEGYGEEAFREALDKAVTPFEADGWQAEKDKSFNHYRRFGGTGYRVGFRRWV